MFVVIVRMGLNITNLAQDPPRKIKPPQSVLTPERV